MVLVLRIEGFEALPPSAAIAVPEKRNGFGDA
jgi:hypothetical protein